MWSAVAAFTALCIYLPERFPLDPHFDRGFISISLFGLLMLFAAGARRRYFAGACIGAFFVFLLWGMLLPYPASDFGQSRPVRGGIASLVESYFLEIVLAVSVWFFANLFGGCAARREPR
ncbi:MAG TPA: hypothetical protein VNC50_20950 [Planctomycetia bacterium]|nr:hypothetical protein [Planctomycetia bacterium]